MAMSQGFESLRNLANDKLAELMKQLKDPKLMPSEQKIEDVIAIRNEIKGIEWWIEKVDFIKKKFEKEV